MASSRCLFSSLSFSRSISAILARFSATAASLAPWVPLSWARSRRSDSTRVSWVSPWSIRVSWAASSWPVRSTCSLTAASWKSRPSICFSIWAERSSSWLCSLVSVSRLASNCWIWAAISAAISGRSPASAVISGSKTIVSSPSRSASRRFWRATSSKSWPSTVRNSARCASPSRRSSTWPAATLSPSRARISVTTPPCRMLDDLAVALDLDGAVGDHRARDPRHRPPAAEADDEEREGRVAEEDEGPEAPVEAAAAGGLRHRRGRRLRPGPGPRPARPAARARPGDRRPSVRAWSVARAWSVSGRFGSIISWPPPPPAGPAAAGRAPGPAAGAARSSRGS